jgi:citrate lyase subunit beta/citryl-CoA lyase
VESAEQVRWVAERVPGVPLTPAIETARGVLAAAEIAGAPGVRMLAVGGIDLQRDLGTSDGALGLLYARSHLVICSRAARIDPPIDSVYPQLADLAGLRDAAQLARSLGLFGKSTVHPRQLPVIHEVFTPAEADLAWAREVIVVFDGAGGAAARLAGGEFVDRPVADRARRLLDLAARIEARG